jgi:hypothetical protein
MTAAAAVAEKRSTITNDFSSEETATRVREEIPVHHNPY